jgi:hypothetical protein
MLPIQALQRHDGSVNTVIVVGDFMLSGSEDKEIKVWLCSYIPDKRADNPICVSLNIYLLMVYSV